MSSEDAALFFYNEGFSLEYKKDRDFQKNRLDKDAHTSSTILLKARINTIGRLRLDIHDTEKYVALKVYCKVDPRATMPLFKTAHEKKNFEIISKTIAQSANEIDYEVLVYQEVAKIPELVNNSIRYVTRAVASLNVTEYNASKNRDSFFKSHPNLKAPLSTNPNYTMFDSLYIAEGTDQLDADAFKKIMPRNMLELHMLVTEFSPGMTLHKYLNSLYAPYAYDIIVPILFQIIWGIQVLQKHGIQHNDMHSQNIFVVLNTPVTMSRIHKTKNGSQFKMPPLAPRILLFDWDFATMKSKRGPKATDPYFCTKYGICTGLNERRDLYLALFEFMNSKKDNLPPGVQTFIDFILQGPVGKEKLGFVTTDDGRLDKAHICNVDPSNPTYCHPYSENEPSQIHDSASLLNHPIFNRYKTDYVATPEELKMEENKTTTARNRFWDFLTSFKETY